MKLNLVSKILFVLIAVLFTPLAAFAGADSINYQPLVGIPGLDGQINFNSYINALYALSISVAALIAVVQIVIAGAKYMLTDVAPQMGEAKADIKNSLIGLLIIIGAVVVLNTINSDLTNFNIAAKPANLNENPIDLDGVTAEEYCDRLDNTSGECISESCSSVLTKYPYIINPAGLESMSCENVCPAIPGYYVDDWGTGTWNSCVYSEDLLQKHLDEYLKSLVTIENCPGGAGSDFENCKASFCVPEGGEPMTTQTYGSAMSNYCRSQCIEDLNGDYIETSNACVHSSGIFLSETDCNNQTNHIWNSEADSCFKYTKSETLTCDEIVEEICDPGSGVCADGSTVTDCSSQINSCSGVALTQNTTVTCYE